MYLNINIIYFIVSCLLISSSITDFGNRNDFPQNTLYIIRILFDPINAITGLILGFLMDKYGFKIINIIISCIEIVASCTIYFSVESKAIFTIEAFLISCCLSCPFITMPPLYNKVFGKELALEIYGLSIIIFLILDILIALFKNFILKDKRSYLIAYLIGGGISLMKLIGLIFFNENKLYKFKSKKEEDDNNMEKLNNIGIGI